MGLQKKSLSAARCEFPWLRVLIRRPLCPINPPEAFRCLGEIPQQRDPQRNTRSTSRPRIPTLHNRRNIEGQIAKAHPSYGHLALAALLKLDKARIVWTVNFERTIEDAAVGVFRTTAKVTVVTPENAVVGRQALEEGRWPIILKPHGDFQSRRLKNTSAELQKQDEELRGLLVDSSARQGLALIGYSGRDQSVMDALAEAVDSRAVIRSVCFGSAGAVNCVPKSNRC